MKPEILYASTVSCPHWLNWLGHLQDQPNVSGLEAGTFRGYSSKWMLENIFTHPTARYYSVDTFEGSKEHQGDPTIDWAVLEAGTRAYLAPHPQSVIIKGQSNHVLHKMYMDCQMFDFTYIDAAHDARNVLRDAVLAFDILKVGGVMIFDDYLWAMMADPLDRPKIAIDSFLSCNAKQIEVLGIGTQVGLKKIREN